MSVLRHNIDEAVATMRSLEALEPQLLRAVDVVSEALRSDHKLLACGNGGSAADAAHLATEFVCRYCNDRRPYAAISLNSSGPDLTAIGNDYAFDEVFSRQVRGFGRRGDVLLAFTTSGRSRNVRLALEAARELGVHTIAFLGRDGGDTRGIADVELLVPGALSARIQEGHKLLLHTLCELVDQKLGH